MTEQPNRRLRVSHVLVQPVLVWDDGDELEPGPTLQAVTLPLSKVADMIERLPGEVAALAGQMAAQAQSADGDLSE